MPSQALIKWQTESAERLDELLSAHERVGGTQRGRRYATEQLNASIVVHVAAHFQLFCRDLHSEAAQALVAAAPISYQVMLRVAFTDRRGLDRRNASPQTIGTDFVRFDLDVWAGAVSRDVRTMIRRTRLEQLNTWRNAIAHQDFVFSEEQRTLLADTSLTLQWARRWQGACSGLTGTFDAVVADHVRAVTGTRPW